jgi:hypothetical protein
VFLIAVGCGGKDPPPVAPGPPIAADPDVSLRSMQDECDALIVALTTYKACPNLEDNDKYDLDAWVESANLSFAAGKKAKPEANALRAMALACHRAAASVQAATERCAAGPRPKDR